MAFEPRIGAWLKDRNAHFRVWAPEAETIDLVLEGPREGKQPLSKQTDGYFTGRVSDISAGQRYRYRVNGSAPFPDVASRYQPRGVHGPSQLVDLRAFRWSDADWQGVDPDRLAIHELHVGAFTPEGTYRAAAEKLPLLRELGVTAIELMPLADFPGERGWGYDGVSIYAPARCYGTPEDLQWLVDRAHQLGLAVLLDVVYNHLGPDGNYTGVYSPYYVSARHHTPWGHAFNLDGPHKGPVREFFFENALHWLEFYHFDGLRLDATHCVADESPKHFFAELAERVHAAFPERRRLLFAEDARNLNTILLPSAQGGWDMDAVWADDFHHEMRRLLHGDDEAYYRDFRGSVEDMATILNRGWLYSGQQSVHHEGPRGTDPAGLAPSQFVISIQNHDQIGNRAFGERLNHEIDPAAYRAVSTVLLLAPYTPLLFMGQEWAASTPFLFFTDHNAELGKLVTAGRRKEFEHFRAFREPETCQRIPDPQAEETFRRSKLVWDERGAAPHAGMLALYQELLKIRGTHPALVKRESWKAIAADADTVVLRYFARAGPSLLLLARLRGKGVFRSDASGGVNRLVDGMSWRVLVNTEQRPFVAEADGADVKLAMGAIEARFERPGAVVLGADG